MMPPNADYFDITAVAPPDREEGWRGASGMPVFVEGLVLGLVQRVPRGYRNERLHATPSWRLHQDPGFLEAIGYKIHGTWRSDIETNIARILDHSAQALNALVEHSDMEALAGANSNGAAEILVGGTLDVAQATEGLARAHNWLAEELQYAPDRTDLESAMKALVDVAQLVAPALVDRGVIAGIRRDRDALASPLVRAPVCLPTAAEVVMAGVDGGAARFRPREAEESYPEGVYSIGCPPECGIDGLADQKAAAKDHAHAKLTPDLRARLGQHVFKTYVRSTSARTRDQEVKAAAVELRNRARKAGRRYYIAIPVPQEPERRAQLDALAHGLKQDLPPIVCLGLDGDFEAELRDRERYGSLCLMLPLEE